MRPILFEIAGYEVRSAGVTYLIAIALAAWYARRQAGAYGAYADEVLPGVTIVVIAAYIGARLHGLISGAQPLALETQRQLVEAHLSFYGGLIAGGLALLAYLRIRKMPIGRAADALAPAAPVVYAIFRLGCLLNGDDYGIPTDWPWGITMPNAHPPVTDPVHPTQVYEIVLMLPVLLWLVRGRKRILRDGVLAFQLCALMGVERFVVDWLRDIPRGLGGLTESQWISLLLIAVGVAGTIALRSPGAPAPQG